MKRSVLSLALLAVVLVALVGPAMIGLGDAAAYPVPVTWGSVKVIFHAGSPLQFLLDILVAGVLL